MSLLNHPYLFQFTCFCSSPRFIWWTDVSDVTALLIVHLTFICKALDSHMLARARVAEEIVSVHTLMHYMHSLRRRGTWGACGVCVYVCVCVCARVRGCPCRSLSIDLYLCGTWLHCRKAHHSFDLAIVEI